jgi:hypothetical protein
MSAPAVAGISGVVRSRRSTAVCLAKTPAAELNPNHLENDSAISPLTLGDLTTAD